MLADCSLLNCYWPCTALTYSCHMKNIFLTARKPDTPHKALHGTDASISFFHPFGCPVRVRIQREQRTHSFAPHSHKGCFLGIFGPIGSRKNAVLVDNRVFFSSDFCFVNIDVLACGCVGPAMQDNIAPVALVGISALTLSASFNC